MNTSYSCKSLIGRRYETTACAKLNLRLKIVGRRADGYHLLSMLNVETDLCDRLTVGFHGRPGVRISVKGSSSSELSNPEHNLAGRAAASLLSEFELPLGVEIELEKFIPQGAGLGGGSADAGAVLRVFRRAAAESNIELDASRLHAIALQLGADVPYFLFGGLAVVEGIGEIVRPICSAPLAAVNAVLMVPPTPILTSELYAEFRQRFPEVEGLSNTDLSKFECAAWRKDEAAVWYEALCALIENDFEKLLPQFSPAVWGAIEQLRSDANIVVGLTGSGSAFFALPRKLGVGPESLYAIAENSTAGQGISVYSMLLRTQSSY